ncbi:hypothetical protein O181_028479 [Austropuccinia psidii MF-1]|uniref:Uncharacterized protein n=1 Tax=Austropuccinia psidii MF-1 TaxID=1389203 RepID=A0A9Q3CQR6_9BASI|nr:hypothetical protein [Austropuccinia psidii MF-1]
MKEGGNVSLFIANFRTLVSRVRGWGERALIHHFMKGLPSRILHQLATNPSRIDSHRDLIDITLEVNTRYHETQKEMSNHQEKNPEALKSKEKKNFQKRDKAHSSLLNKDFMLMNSEK